jgi:hypothetical protein
MTPYRDSCFKTEFTGSELNSLGIGDKAQTRTWRIHWIEVFSTYQQTLRKVCSLATLVSTRGYETRGEIIYGVVFAYLGFLGFLKYRHHNFVLTNRCDPCSIAF